MSAARPDASTAPALEAAFRATDYVVALHSGPLVLAVDRPAPPLATLVRTHPPGAAFVTAVNPGARRLSETANRARNRALRARIADAGLQALPAFAEARDRSWPREDAVLVLGVDRGTARALGRAFGQAAVLWAGADGCPRLVWCDRA